jgi:hypothetical protein
MGMTKWGSLAIAVLLVFLTLWFQPGGSLMTAFITGVVLSVAGYFMLKSPKKH